MSLIPQHLVDRFQPDEQNPSQFFIAHAAVAIVDGQKVHFDPQRRVINLVGQRPAERSLITPEDWAALRDHVVGERSMSLVRSLITGAYRLASQGLRRNALVDGVTALEVALNAYARAADVEQLKRFKPGIESKSIPMLIEKVGLRGAFGVAVPLLFTDEEFPADLLSTCRTAIERRNNIVHHGTRDIEERDLLTLLSGIKQACDLFEKYSVQPSTDETVSP